MKQPQDRFMLDLLDKPGRGRPRKPDALTPAERARRYRARQSVQRAMERKASGCNYGAVVRLRNQQAKGSIEFDVLAGLVLDFFKPAVNLA